MVIIENYLSNIKKIIKVVQTKNKIIEVVVGIIRNENNEILMAKRKQDQFMPNYWELPGGKIEVGEDSFKAL